MVNTALLDRFRVHKTLKTLERLKCSSSTGDVTTGGLETDEKPSLDIWSSHNRSYMGMTADWIFRSCQMLHSKHC